MLAGPMLYQKVEWLPLFGWDRSFLLQAHLELAAKATTKNTAVVVEKQLCILGRTFKQIQQFVQSCLTRYHGSNHVYILGRSSKR